MSVDPLSSTFAALADPTRRAIVARLAQGEATVGDLASPFHISLPSVSRHIRVLENAQLIECTRQAQWRVCRLRGAPLQEMAQWVEQYRAFWASTFDSLAHYVEQAKRAAKAGGRPTGKPKARKRGG
ncbi:MAG: metalloregulator ArsR/SmtB family transcription factor [Burkholderiaceae bacterium]